MKALFCLTFIWICMGNGRQVVYEFGRFQLDLTRQMLWRHGAPVALAPKVFDTLVLLVQNPGLTGQMSKQLCISADVR